MHGRVRVVVAGVGVLRLHLEENSSSSTSCCTCCCRDRDAVVNDSMVIRGSILITEGSISLGNPLPMERREMSSCDGGLGILLVRVIGNSNVKRVPLPSPALKNRNMDRVY